MGKTASALGVDPKTMGGADPKAGIDWQAANRVADAIFAQKTLSEWAPILKQHDVWYKPIHRFEDQRDPTSVAYQQSKAVGVFTEGNHVPGISRHDLLATPVKLSQMPALPRGSAPRFGEHTHAILAEVGLSDTEAAALLDEGVVAVSKGVYRQQS
jgi:crotonobetainyl-CoA:carnitine CoA-transferase CaiB-like acyl-CoA transferase